MTQARLAAQIDDPNVRIVDLRIPGESAPLQDDLLQDPPAAVGISATFTSNGDQVKLVADAVRRTCPSTPILLGGTAVSEEPDAFLDSAADLICSRRGDVALPAFVRALRRDGVVPDEPAGFLHRRNGTWRAGPAAPAAPLSSLRPNAWDRIPSRYWRSYYEVHSAVGMGLMSEGCPYDCNFCSVWKTHGRQVQLTSLDNIRHDFESTPPFARVFFFADDIWLQGSEKQLRELYDPLLDWLASDHLPRRRHDLELTIETRTDLFLRQQERFREWTRRGGLKAVLFGVEAVTDSQLQKYGKRNTTDVNSDAIRLAAGMGLNVLAQIVVPCDADRAYFDEILRFFEEHKRWINVTSFSVATPLPGTDLYSEALGSHPDLADRGIVRHPAFSLFTALLPTRLPIEEFYGQLARLFRATRNIRTYRKDMLRSVSRYRTAPWLLKNLPRTVRLLRNLTRAETFLEIHRNVQDERLFGAP
jgi:magnesium-protoporphyrin IX monomethyl ester (oxidative) cyclase